MIPNRKLLDAFYRVYNDGTAKRTYPDELNAILAAGGVDFTLFQSDRKKRMKPGDRPVHKCGRVIGTDDGKYWMGLKHCWARCDAQGPLAVQAYEKLYAEMDDRRQERGPQDKVYQRVKYFNTWHPEQAVETPKEARRKFLETGYIPDYIDRNGIE